MQKLVLATSNNGKLKEVREILDGIEVLSLKDIGFNGEIIEDGKTLYENALIKAKTIAKIVNMPVLADDSGIFVDVLNGEPGIYSARYAGDGNSEHNIQKLLNNLQNYNSEKERSARFICQLVLYKPNGEIIAEDGKTEGYILFNKCGENGFGYDPIFYSYDLKKSLGLATDKEKNSISHRGRALEKIRSKIYESL